MSEHLTRPEKIKTKHDSIKLLELESSYVDFFKKYNQIVEKVRLELKKKQKVINVNNLEIIKSLIKSSVSNLNEVRELSKLEPIQYKNKNFLPPVSMEVAIDDFFDLAKRINTSKDVFDVVATSKRDESTLVYDESKHFNFLERLEEFEVYLEFLTHYQG